MDTAAYAACLRRHLASKQASRKFCMEFSCSSHTPLSLLFFWITHTEATFFSLALSRADCPQDDMSQNFQVSGVENDDRTLKCAQDEVGGLRNLQSSAPPGPVDSHQIVSGL